MIAVFVLYVPRVIRTVRAAVIEYRDADFVQAARSLGASNVRILLLHIFPRAIGPTMIQLSLGFSSAILVEAGLSFLGLGAPPPAPTWGGMISGAREYIRTAPWMMIAPGAIITGLERAAALPGKIFHAATDRQGESVVTSGGRVLCAVGLGDGVVQAQRAAYELVRCIDFPGAQYRHDIGYRAIARER